jgi:hypothetical protein
MICCVGLFIVFILQLIILLTLSKNKEGLDLAQPRQIVFGGIPIDARQVIDTPGEETDPLSGPSDDELINNMHYSEL